MQVILLHHRFSARTVTLNHWHLGALALGFLAAVLLAASLLYYVTLRYAHRLDIPLVKDAIAAAALADAERKDRYIKENLAAMAVRLGQMQAQLTRLDALGERVQGLAGVKPEEFNFREPPPQGGPESESPDEPLSMNEFQRLLDVLARDVEYRADYMNVVESSLMNYKIRTRLLPTVQPVNVGYRASGFGWRVDPFTGRGTRHEGIDFAAPAGTPIRAAAGGVVITAKRHYQYGNMIDIDHGNDIVTRYAHASRLHVKAGDIVRRGQHIADVGSTGRSTGAHLHFEVLVKGAPQNPHKFLAAAHDPAKLAALAARLGR